jgi:hypothetical protein
MLLSVPTSYSIHDLIPIDRDPDSRCHEDPDWHVGDFDRAIFDADPDSREVVATQRRPDAGPAQSAATGLHW